MTKYCLWVEGEIAIDNATLKEIVEYMSEHGLHKDDVTLERMKELDDHVDDSLQGN